MLTVMMSMGSPWPTGLCEDVGRNGKSRRSSLEHDFSVEGVVRRPPFLRSRARAVWTEKAGNWRLTRPLVASKHGSLAPAQGSSGRLCPGLGELTHLMAFLWSLGQVGSLRLKQSFCLFPMGSLQHIPWVLRVKGFCESPCPKSVLNAKIDCLACVGGGGVGGW